MKSKIFSYIVIMVVISIVIGFFAFENGQTQSENNAIFHVTLADPQNYENEVYRNSFEIDEGTYAYKFVPNGDSPHILTISLKGKSINYSESFGLEGTPHETDISTYYTWKYSGNNGIVIPEKQEVEITINPNGELHGPVSVYIIKQ